MQNNFGSLPKPLEGYASLFLRFGLLAWGGPIARIAMIRKELVEEEKWISTALLRESSRAKRRMLSWTELRLRLWD
jgi:hypothetical protein